MSKFIVTTTINKPTIATLKYCQIAVKKNWKFVIVGDLKTPHEEYKSLENDNIIYLSPEKQESFCKELSDVIGWKTIQRRNIGFVAAYKMGAEIIATVDDDNIPYENWGQNLFVNKTIDVDLYEPEINVFDPLSITKNNHLWHRGYPIDHLLKRHRVEYKGKIKRRVLVQADLWDGDPDIDALARLTYKPIINYKEIIEPFCSNQISPFNSQNTFLHREVIPYYAVLPNVGRMDDIWGGYILQNYFKDNLIYCPSSVYQDRNVQDLITNLEKEIIGYRNTNNLINDLSNYENYLPEETKSFYHTYKKQFII